MMIEKIGRIRFAILFVLTTGLLLSSCGRDQPSTRTSAVSETDIIAMNKGKVQVLLLGMKGCPGTEAATPFLAQYSAEKSDGVAIARVEVPLPDRTGRMPADIDPALNVLLDTNRKLAAKLDFFFYPTLYVLDKDGIVRYTGKCEESEVRKMVAEILSEDPAKPKKMYTLPLPKIGTKITGFSGLALDGKTMTLEKLKGEKATLLLFSTTTCPFSVQAVESLPELVTQFKNKGLKLAVINFGQSADAIKVLYTQKAGDVAVIVDENSEISEKTFGVTAVPFFYVLNKDLEIVEHKPYTVAMAEQSIGEALGIEGCGGSSTGAG